MLHIATVHWGDDRWVDIQLRYLRAHAGSDFRVYAFLHGLPQDHRAKYHYCRTDPIESHATKLNLLAQAIAEQASASDLLMFIDGDAFPIADLSPFLDRTLGAWPLAAVQRRENNGDMQPHPCCCVTTVGFWRDLGGDWESGHQWRDACGNLVTDVGGNLLAQLEARRVAWYPMLRSNRRDLHPLLFGVYDDIVYHHGAGFSPAIPRVDHHALFARTRMLRRGVARMLPAGLRDVVRRRFGPWAFHRRTVERNEVLSRAVFESIKADPRFYQQFRDHGDGTDQRNAPRGDT